MTGKCSRTIAHIEDVLRHHTVEELAERLEPNVEGLPPKLPGSSKVSAERADRIWDRLEADHAVPGDVRSVLLSPAIREEMGAYQGSIENGIGAIRIPLGIAGPLRVNGFFAKGDYLVPLATTEAALVASYHRGASLLTEAGGCSAVLLFESISRSPSFSFRKVAEAGRFVAWAMGQFEAFEAVARTTTQHGELVDIGTTVEGNHVYLDFEFRTADASGQNMVTLATQAICDHILEHTPVDPVCAYVEANLSGDKKASARAFMNTRGKKVTAEVVLPAALVEKRLHTTPGQMCEYWRTSAIGGVLSGTIGIQGHFANGLAAVYLATGQDVACVAESAVGITRFELTEAGDLYAAVTLPGIMVGTVGGGTGLPGQHACLRLMGLSGAGNARALAEVVAGLLLGGELSIIGALAAGQFTRAHSNLARRRRAGQPDSGASH